MLTHEGQLKENFLPSLIGPWVSLSLHCQADLDWISWDYSSLGFGVEK